MRCVDCEKHSFVANTHWCDATKKPKRVSDKDAYKDVPCKRGKMMSDRLLKESDILKIAFQLPFVVNSAFYDAVKALPSADIPKAKNLNTDYASCDQFICSKCGIHLQDWVRMDDEYDDIVHEYEFKYCPNCGLPIEEEDNEQML